MTVNCPTCHAEVPWSVTSTYRPFCSPRCRAIDLGEWASDRFAIPGNELTDAPGGATPAASGVKQ